ncbi:MAG TPA: AarF/UbiB family protein [Acidimicrobiales bacterium]|nr:AarF/UbiB family protein [Acidimicrobiales bacterium]
MTGASIDTDYGSFTDNGPWVVDPNELAWKKGLDRVRRDVHASVPTLTRYRRVPPAGRMLTTLRALGIPLAIWALRERKTDRSIPGISRRLRVAAERLGPTYIKLGQIISSGEGIFPEPLVVEFRKCRDRVRAEPFDVVRRVVEEDFLRPLDSVFRTFDREPIAAASIAQVHAATLSTGEEVVVKVQRPQVKHLVERDLRVMSYVAPHLVGRIPVAALANPPALVELFAETIVEELDFRLEAENMLDVAHAFALLGQRGYVIPRPHPTLVTRRVLVMERLSGFAFEDVAGMKNAGVDTHNVVRTGMIGGMEGALIHGIFHGDLHGGNLFVQPDGRTALLDFGITGRLSEPKRLALLRLLIAGSMNDVNGQLQALRDLGALPPDTDIEAVIADLGLDRPPVDPTKMTGEELVSEIQQTMKALLGIGARMPKELMLFVKNMMFLDGAIATLAPDLDIFGEIADISMHFATTHGEHIAAELGLDPDAWQLDMTGVKASFGLDDSIETLTYRELQDRRNVIRERLESQRPDRSKKSRRLPFKK